MSVTTHEWATMAACRGSQREAFYPPNAIERREQRLEREAVAKRICAGCAVSSQCLDLAIATHESHGIWGGCNEDERRALARVSSSNPAA